MVGGLYPLPLGDNFMKIRMTQTYTTPAKANSKRSVQVLTSGATVEMRTLEALAIVAAGKAVIV